ncbi:MAG: RNA ligase, partial [Halobacteria archaeon]|nr:RNA ligase [Halobacteria archaeon]
HTVRGSEEEVDAILNHLRDMGIHVNVEDRRNEGGDVVVEFIKKTQSTNDKIDAYLDGVAVKE